MPCRMRATDFSTNERNSARLALLPGDTISITAFKDAKAAPPAKPQPPSSASDDEYERQEEEPVDQDAETADDIAAEAPAEEFGDDFEDEEAEEEAAQEEAPEEFIDESNPFYVKKKAPEGPAKPVYKDTSDAATDILRKMMERRRSQKS